MRKAKIGSFDAVITMFNAIGHLKKPDFEKALKNIHKNLKDDGIYVFDIFNLEAMSDDVVTSLTMDINKIVNGTKVRNVQYSVVDRTNGLLTSYDKHYPEERQ